MSGMRSLNCFMGEELAEEQFCWLQACMMVMGSRQRMGPLLLDALA